jgi:peptidoglycan hydrolase CwlO-like protein
MSLRRMIMKMLLGLLLLASTAHAVDRYGQLTKDDQKYYKNDSMDGKNQFERIDSAVAEINKLHGELASMKAEMQQLRKEVDELKKAK